MRERQGERKRMPSNPFSHDTVSVAGVVLLTVITAALFTRQQQSSFDPEWLSSVSTLPQ